MGELRDSILEMGKQVAAAAKKGEALAADLDTADQAVISCVQRLEGGCDVLWMYLDSMFTKNNRKIADHLPDKLSQHADSEVVGYLKGIDQAADDAIKAIGRFKSIKAKMPAEYDRIDALAANIQRNIGKKRSKLIQSKKYKAKIATYDKALDELVRSIAGRRSAFAEIETIDTSSVERLRIKSTATLAEAQTTCTVSVKQGLKTMKAEVAKGEWISRKFRENGDLKTAFGQMKQWAGEADSMDQEVLNLDPNAAKPIQNVRIYQGQRLVGTAPKAVFQGKRPMEVPSVTWEKGVDSLSFLQKKVTLRARYASGDGEFTNDMKINGIKGSTVKLT